MDVAFGGQGTYPLLVAGTPQFWTCQRGWLGTCTISPLYPSTQRPSARSSWEGTKTLETMNHPATRGLCAAPTTRAGSRRQIMAGCFAHGKSTAADSEGALFVTWSSSSVLAMAVSVDVLLGQGLYAEIKLRRQSCAVSSLGTPSSSSRVPSLSTRSPLYRLSWTLPCLPTLSFHARSARGARGCPTYALSHRRLVRCRAGRPDLLTC